MNQDLKHNWHIPQRQSNAGLFIILYKSGITILKTVWPFLIIFLFKDSKNSSNGLLILIIATGIFILLAFVINFYFFRFYITGNELIIRKGFIRKKIISIPLNNIQSVHIEQPWMHQLLSVAKLKIDTAGSEKTEAEIDAISVTKAEMLRAFLLDSQDDVSLGKESLPQNTEVVRVRLSFSDILKLGLTANHIYSFFIILAFFFSFYNRLEDIFGKKVFGVIEESSSLISLTVSAILIAVVLVLTVSLIVSLILIVLKYFDFQLFETGKGFKINSGLTTTRQNLVPFSKIQYISWSANWIRRKIGLYMMEFHLANSNDAKIRQGVTVPVIQNSRIEFLLMHYHSNIATLAHSTHRIHPVYAFRRMLLFGLPIALVTAAISIPFLKGWAFLFLLFVPYIFINSLIFRKNFRLYISPEAMQVYSGIWGRENKILQWNKIQKITLQQSIYQQRKNIANLIIYTAGGLIKIPYITLELAHLLRNYALYKIESSEKSWM